MVAFGRVWGGVWGLSGVSWAILRLFFGACIVNASQKMFWRILGLILAVFLRVWENPEALFVVLRDGLGW